MRVGFVHGVMNTDNMTISGETIDYGPCAFMDRYHPQTVFSSIDQHGRYAYDKQADIALWNLAQLASALLPLLGDDGQEAIDRVTAVLHDFPRRFTEAWLEVFRPKIGLATARDGDAELIHRLLDRMTTTGADFTNTFHALSEGRAREEFGAAPDAFDAWEAEWTARLAHEPAGATERMRAANPGVIPRNHRVEEVIRAAMDGDFAPFHRLFNVVTQPFGLTEGYRFYTTPPSTAERVTRTFCGT